MLPSTVGLLGERSPNVDKLARKGNVEGLVRALSYEDVVANREGTPVDLGAPVRERAVIALTQEDSPAAQRGLLRSLEDPEERVRIAAIKGLREHPDAAATTGLLDLVVDSHEASRVASRNEAIQALDDLSEPGVAERLVAGLLRRPDELDESDRLALLRVAGPGARDGGERAVDHLLQVLGSDADEATMARASTLLVWLAPQSVDALLLALTDPDLQVRAARALGEVKDSRAVDALCALLEAEDPKLREAAAWALGEIKDPVAVEALLAIAGDSDHAVRAAAASSLDKMGTVAIVIGVTAFMRPLLGEGSTPVPGSGLDADLSRAALRAPGAQAATGSEAVEIHEAVLRGGSRERLRRLVGRSRPS